MHYLKKELQKILPLALLFGAIGGVLLIILTNLIVASAPMVLVLYGALLALSVYILNKKRYRKDTGSSILYGYLVFAVMTVISFLDMVMNANPEFVNPVFESLGLFLAIMFAVPVFAGAVSIVFKRKVVS
ncbi:MAG: hypothetical protein HUJ25_07855 [Crocinitomicaceae bacterium]|nr:hypothetical protein [Crocinitomicaceae bacterium]